MSNMDENIHMSLNVTQSNTSMNTNDIEASSSGRSSRKRSSKVWQHFTETILEDGTKRALCNYCNASFACSNNVGTSHMSRHNSQCPKRVLQSDNQSLSRQGFDRVLSFKFDQEFSRLQLAKMIIMQELPFTFVEHITFKNFGRSLNPEFVSVTRNTIKADCEKVYQEEKKKVMKKLSQGCERVSLTADLWTSNQTLGYMSITAHFVDINWKLQKHIIEFSMVESPHTGAALAKVILKSLVDWGVDRKNFSLTLDNSSANDVLSRLIRSNLVEKQSLLLEGKFFHVRCCAHILNLIVQDGLNEARSAVYNVRESVKYVKSSQGRKQKFEEIIQQVGLHKRKGLPNDVPTRWNSTYMMLDAALFYKKAFIALETWDTNFLCAPSLDDWSKAEFMCKFLKIFYNATNVFSKTEEPTSNMALLEICNVQKLLRQEQVNLNEFVCSMVAKMQDKFDKYWAEIEDSTLLFAIATVLDPRYKMIFVTHAFMELYGHDAPSRIAHVRQALHDLFNAYLSQFASSNVSEHNIDIHENENVIIEAHDDDDILSGFDNFLHSQALLQDSKSELDQYLEESVISRSQKNFTILVWWKENTVKYPILSRMARDILGIPASTVASESAFSTGGRIIDQYRSSLNPETIETLICSQDWLRDNMTELSLSPESLG